MNVFLPGRPSFMVLRSEQNISDHGACFNRLVRGHDVLERIDTTNGMNQSVLFAPSRDSLRSLLTQRHWH
jgi:hypothetical protein